MFSRAKRFDERPVGCGADAAYNPKDPMKPIGGVIPKEDRFCDADSVHSDKSSLLFRTPKTVRRLPLNFSSKKFTFDEALMNDLVEAKNVEIRNKNETICEYENQMREMKDKINMLENKLLNYSCDEKFPDTTADTDFDMKDTIQELESKIAELNVNYEKKVQDSLAMADLLNANKETLCEFEERLKEKLLEINELTENIALIKGQHALASEANESIRHEYKIEIDSLRSKHNEELKKNRDIFDVEKKQLEHVYELKLSQTDENFTKEINKHQMQFEEQLKDLQQYADSQINKRELEESKKLQEFDENIKGKIACYENEIEELKTVLSTNEKNMDLLSNNLLELQQHINDQECLLNKLEIKLQTSENDKESLQKLNSTNMFNLQNEIDRLNKDKINFSVTLETTRQTVDVLGSRLRNSDEHVEKLKTELEDAMSMNKSYETQISRLIKEYNDFKTEYNTILITIVESKSILDKKHGEILQENDHLVEALHSLESEVWNSIKVLKDDLFKDIDSFKEASQEIINEYEFKLIKSHNDYMSIKLQCDNAYEKIIECQQLLSSADAQIETKDQELDEISTENVRLSGTLMALEQEKNELKILSSEFLMLLDEKDRKIHDYLKMIDDREKTLIEKHDSITKLTQLLEATEFIVFEKDKEISQQKDEISQHSSIVNNLNIDHAEFKQKFQKEIDEISLINKMLKEKCVFLENKISNLSSNVEKDLKKDQEILELTSKLQIAESHMASCEAEFLRKHCSVLESELAEITIKYTNLMGHQNSKQKIKHIADLKIQNNSLKEENEKLHFEIDKYTATIDKLKKKLADSVKAQTPLSHKKQFSHYPLNSGKENAVNVSHSPSRLGSPQASMNRTLTPLKDSNR